MKYNLCSFVSSNLILSPEQRQKLRWLGVGRLVFKVKFLMFSFLYMATLLLHLMAVGGTWKTFFWCHLQSSWKDEHNSGRFGTCFFTLSILACNYLLCIVRNIVNSYVRLKNHWQSFEDEPFLGMEFDIDAWWSADGLWYSFSFFVFSFNVLFWVFRLSPLWELYVYISMCQDFYSPIVHLSQYIMHLICTEGSYISNLHVLIRVGELLATCYLSFVVIIDLRWLAWKCWIIPDNITSAGLSTT